MFAEWFFFNGEAVGHPYTLPKDFILSSFWINQYCVYKNKGVI
jgi:hypothetical protein